MNYSHTMPKIKSSWVKVSQVRTLAAERIGRKLARATDDELREVIDGLTEIVGYA